MTTWSFRGTPFLRMEPSGAARAWPESLAVTVDVVAGDVGAVPRRYVDVGAIQHEAWAVRAGCPAQADRDTLVAMRYTTGELTTVGGAMYQALCTRATPIAHDGSGVYEADLTFELLS
jgi:hypothetical protein